MAIKLLKIKLIQYYLFSLQRNNCIRTEDSYLVKKLQQCQDLFVEAQLQHGSGEIINKTVVGLLLNSVEA